MRKTSPFPAIAVAAALAACGGGGERGPRAPVVSGLSSVQLPQDTTSAPVGFTVLDPDTLPSMLILSVESSNPALLPPDGIRLAGSGNSRTLTLTPAPEATGTATVTVRVRDDAGLTSSATLAVTVQAVLRSFKGLASDTFAASDATAPASLQGFTLQPDADDDPNAFDALLQ